MAKVIGFPSSSVCGRRLSVVGLLFSRLQRSAHRPAPLNPEEWSDRMLKDIGLSDQAWSERLPSRDPWLPR
ncbi:MAG TPA: hypothetical protein VKB42_05640 [Dongiaceae bacterium]|nr:hypothetical protein [Dongiaceae bacterium]